MRIAHALPMLVLFTFATPSHAAEYVMMKVGTQDVSSTEAASFWEGLFPAGKAPAFESVKPEVRDKVLRGVMAEKLLLAEAQKQGIDKSKEVTRQLEAAKQKIIVRALLDAKTSDSITDADVKKEYDSMIALMKDEREVRARHILLPSEAEAKDARKKIDGGKTFEEVALATSKDAGSAKLGGDLGYFTRDKMVKEFADAAFSLKKGEVSPPVKSSFGWHIIKVEDVRNAPAPSFADSKETIRGALQEKKLNDYVAGLVKNAEVKLFDAQGKQLPFDKNLPPQAIPTAAKPEKKTEKPAVAPAPKVEKTEAKPEKTSATDKKEVEAHAKSEKEKPAKPNEKATEKPVAEKSPKVEKPEATPAEKTEKEKPAKIKPIEKSTDDIEVGQ